MDRPQLPVFAQLQQLHMQAILTHGCLKGVLLGAWRIARCNPLGKWGYDPVPPPGRWQSPARNLQPAKLFCTRHKRKVEK